MKWKSQVRSDQDPVEEYGLDDLIKRSNAAVVAFVDDEAKKVLVIPTSNALEAIWRNTRDVKKGTHKIGELVQRYDKHRVVILEYTERHKIKHRYSRWVSYFTTRGYSLYTNMQCHVKYKKGVRIELNEAGTTYRALACLVTARNDRLVCREFDTIPEAKAYLEQRSFDQLLDDHARTGSRSLRQGSED